MPLLRKKGLLESSRVLFLPLSEISPNPNQPRRNFSQEGLVELAASIQEHGCFSRFPCGGRPEATS